MNKTTATRKWVEWFVANGYGTVDEAYALICEAERQTGYKFVGFTKKGCIRMDSGDSWVRYRYLMKDFGSTNCMIRFDYVGSMTKIE